MAVHQSWREEQGGAGDPGVTHQVPGSGMPAASTDAALPRSDPVHPHVETLAPIDHHESFKSPAGINVRRGRRRVSLLRTIAADLGNYFFTYMLGAILCGLSIFKVVQVQETRDLIANLNEVSVHNENLNKAWLTLLAQRQELSEHNKIRLEAAQRLGMRAPKTEAERVITIK